MFFSKSVTLVIIILVIIWEFILEPKIIKYKIKKYILAIDAELLTIESQSKRESTYLVEYMKDNQVYRKIAKFNLILNSTWR